MSKLPEPDDSFRKNLANTRDSQVVAFYNQRLDIIVKQIFTSYCEFQIMMSHSETLVQNLMPPPFPKHTILTTKVTCKGPFFPFRKEALRKKSVRQSIQYVLTRKDDTCDVSLLKNYLADGGETTKPVRPSSNLGGPRG